MKRVFALLLGLVMAAALVACGEKESSGQGQSVDLRAAYTDVR